MTTYQTRHEALHNNAEFYFSGMPCKKEHIANRIAHCGRCTECVKLKRKNYRLESLYGITLEEANLLLKLQGYTCAICKHQFDEIETSKIPVVDHCHVEGHIRRILCNQCNTMLGMVKDSVHTLESAIKYLNRSASGFAQ